MERDTTKDFRSAYEELERRLMAEPNVVRVAFTDRLPRSLHPEHAIEIEEKLLLPTATVRFHIA